MIYVSKMLLLSVSWDGTWKKTVFHLD